MHNIIDEKFWLAIAFTAFAVLVFKYVWPILSRSISDKSKQIAQDLNDAKNAKLEAESLLIKTEEQYKIAIENSQKILVEARLEAKKFMEDSKLAIEDEVKKKVGALEDRIKNEEARVVRDIKAKIISIAIRNAKDNLQDVDKDKFENVIKKSIDDVSKLIH